MKFLSLLLLLLLANAVGAQTRMSVTTGSGDGRYRGQGFPDVFADPAPTGTVFDRWTGDVHLLERTDEWHTRVRTGTKNISLTATYRPTATWAPTAPEIVGTTQMRYYFPPNYVGVVIHFHGSGGNLNSIYAQFEQTVYVRDLVDAGYAIVTLSSDDRASGQWSQLPAATNPDVANVRTLLETLTARGLITPQTPVFASGSSRGGGFAPQIAFLFNFRGTAVFIATSVQSLINQTTVPTIWNIAQNDTTLAPGSVEAATLNFVTLRNRGIAAELNILRPSPVFPERFRRIPALSAADSVNIYNALKQNGFLDRNDMLRANPRNSGWENVIPPAYAQVTGQIGDQLWISYAEHQFFSEYSRRVIRFFNALR